jgi:hypothetical protein
MDTSCHGSSNTAYALFTFSWLAAYERYRMEAETDPECVSVYKRHCCVDGSGGVKIGCDHPFESDHCGEFVEGCRGSEVKRPGLDTEFVMAAA